MNRNMNSQLIQIQLLILRAYCVRGDPIKSGWDVCHNEDLDVPMQTWSTDDQDNANAAPERNLWILLRSPKGSPKAFTPKYLDN